MRLNMGWLVSFFRPHRETDQEKVERLQREAIRLEVQATFAEETAKLRTRIDSAKKRIEATRPKGKGDAVSTVFGFLFQHKVIVGIAVLILVVFIVSKSCK